MPQFEYDAICFRQREQAKTWFCQVSAPAGEILSWARVDRLEPDNVKGVQRTKNESRTRAIRLFFQADSTNTIPTTMTIALPIEATNFGDLLSRQEGSRPAAVRLRISVEDGVPLPGLIIDGQHRIFGINEFDRSIPVAAVIVLGADDAEIAFQFLVINNKVAKVSPDHIRALRLAYAEDMLDERLSKSARMKVSGASAYLEAVDATVDSPFRGRLNWPRNSASDEFQLIPPNAFEAAFLHISNQQLLSGSDPDMRNSDFVVDLFLEVWKEVQARWPQAWTERSSRLLSKVGVVCMSQYLVDTLLARIEASDDINDIKNLERVRQIVGTLLDRLVYEFWTAPWTVSSLDTSAGRALINADLRKIAINKRSGSAWESGLRLVASLD